MHQTVSRFEVNSDTLDCETMFGCTLPMHRAYIRTQIQESSRVQLFLGSANPFRFHPSFLLESIDIPLLSRRSVINDESAIRSLCNRMNESSVIVIQSRLPLMWRLRSLYHCEMHPPQLRQTRETSTRTSLSVRHNSCTNVRNLFVLEPD